MPVSIMKELRIGFPLVQVGMTNKRVSHAVQGKQESRALNTRASQGITRASCGRAGVSPTRIFQVGARACRTCLTLSAEGGVGPAQMFSETESRGWGRTSGPQALQSVIHPAIASTKHSTVPQEASVFEQEHQQVLTRDVSNEPDSDDRDCEHTPGGGRGPLTLQFLKVEKTPAPGPTAHAPMLLQLVRVK